ncbi:MAG: NAD-dependent epimerase/dehydratase family protein [Deltaproteobacteria bacterium]|nr:NAD-dependent epimerase/dehydratase family protein [Deltaproteobacteria bacterium]
MTTLLTGATGFLGKNLLRELLSRGETVRVLVRSPEALGVTHERLEVVPGDLRDDAALDLALAGAKRVYHVAAVVKEWVTDWSIFDRVNVDAYETLLKKAMAAGVERIVHTSSFMAIGHSDANQIADESLEHEPKHFHNPYERTKYLASLVTKRYLDKGAPIVTVLPGVIFGPGELTEGNIVLIMIRDMWAGKFPGIPGDGKKLWSYAFVRDVVAGHVLAMEKGQVGRAYILGGDNVSLDMLVDLAAERLGKKVPKRHIPLGLLSFSAFFMEKIAGMTGKPPMLTRGKVGVLAHNWAYDSTRAKNELGYTITPFEHALEESIRWMREQGVITD